MASKGQLTRKAIKDLIDQMGKASQGAAKTQMDSWNGMISNMGDSWTMFKTDVMDSGAFEVLKKELGGLLSQLDEMKKTGEYDALVDKVGGNLVEAFRAAAEAIRETKELGEELIPVFKALGEGANWVADLAGGYENVAKVMAGIYVFNKGARFLAPAAKGAMSVGGWAAGAIFSKGKGGAGGMGDAISNLGATPVYVVNMPGSGFGDGSLPAAGNQSGNKGTLNVQKLIAGGTALYGVSLIPELGGLPKFSRAEERAKELADKGTGLLNLSTDGISPAPGILDVFDEMKAFFTRDITPSPRPDNLGIDIKVSDDRITVRSRDVAPGMQVRVDNGPSLMP